MRDLVDAHLSKRLSEFMMAHKIESIHTLDMSKKMRHLIQKSFGLQMAKIEL